LGWQSGDTIISGNQIGGPSGSGTCFYIYPVGYGERFKVTANKMDTCLTSINLTNVIGSMFVGTGSASGSQLLVNGTADGKSIDPSGENSCINNC
jgi:cellulase/cellobiase CelA1